MNDDYKPLIFPGLETYPNDYDSFINNLKNKIAYCEENKLNALKKELTTGLQLVEYEGKNEIKPLEGLDFYRIGFNSKNQYSIQLWSRRKKSDRISYKKATLKIIDYNFLQKK